MHATTQVERELPEINYRYLFNDIFVDIEIRSDSKGYFILWNLFFFPHTIIFY